MSKSPVHKRLRLDPSASPSPPLEREGGVILSNEDDKNSALPRGYVARAPMTSGEDDEDYCVICLQHIRDRTVLPCAHDRMCFECILVWTAQSRKCPLCNAPIGGFLIHNIRSKYDYQKRYLPPLRSSPPPVVSPLSPLRGSNSTRNRGHGATSRWGNRRRSTSRERQNAQDQLELAVERRRWIYRHSLYAKHVASNPYTRYRPAPTPGQIAASPDLISRATIFVRRELRVWVNLDVEFLTTFILSLMKSLDLRSESAVKLLAEFLDMDTPYYIGEPLESAPRFQNAEHFAHELYSYLRSPYRELATYDSVVQYDTPEHITPAPSRPREERRWDVHFPTRAGSPTRHRRHSSPSPLSHSPRDAHSRSPSPVQSHSREARRGISYLSREHEGVSRDWKAKAKESVPPRLNRGDDNSRRTSVHHSGRRSRSPRHDPAPSRHRRTHVAEEPRSPRTTSEAQDLPPRGSDGSYITSAIPTKLIPDRITSPNSRRNTIDVLSRIAGNSHHSGQSTSIPPPTPAKVETTWGISIKGQAKLLQKTRDSLDPIPGGSQDSRIHTAKDGISESKILGSGAPGSMSRDGVENVPAIGPVGGRITHETQNGESPAGNTVFGHTEDSLPIDHPARVPSAPLRSAPEIMARTRAKLAKLRGQASVAGVAAASNTSDSSGRSTSANLAMRTRLLERLEQEKKQASYLSTDETPVPGGRSQSDGPARTEPAIDRAAGSPSILLPDSQQAEIKLRTQALLRVRLAAEKRRLEEG